MTILQLVLFIPLSLAIASAILPSEFKKHASLFVFFASVCVFSAAIYVLPEVYSYYQFYAGHLSVFLLILTAIAISSLSFSLIGRAFSCKIWTLLCLLLASISMMLLSGSVLLFVCAWFLYELTEYYYSYYGSGIKKYVYAAVIRVFLVLLAAVFIIISQKMQSVYINRVLASPLEILSFIILILLAVDKGYIFRTWTRTFKRSQSEARIFNCTGRIVSVVVFLKCVLWFGSFNIIQPFFIALALLILIWALFSSYCSETLAARLLSLDSIFLVFILSLLSINNTEVYLLLFVLLSTKILLFTSLDLSGEIVCSRYSSEKISELGNIIPGSPISGTAMLLALIFLTGLPPFAVFWYFAELSRVLESQISSSKFGYFLGLVLVMGHIGLFFNIISTVSAVIFEKKQAALRAAREKIDWMFPALYIPIILYFSIAVFPGLLKVVTGSWQLFLFDNISRLLLLLLFVVAVFYYFFKLFKFRKTILDYRNPPGQTTPKLGLDFAFDVGSTRGNANKIFKYIVKRLNYIYIRVAAKLKNEILKKYIKNN